MSTKTPENAHDPTTQRESDADAENDEMDDGLVVVVCPRGTHDELRPELEAGRAQLYERYEKRYEDLLAERAQLEDEVSCLERQLERKESQLDAVITRNERILEERTESYRREISARENRDDCQWTGRRQEFGLLERLKNLLR